MHEAITNQRRVRSRRSASTPTAVTTMAAQLSTSIRPPPSPSVRAARERMGSTPVSALSAVKAVHSAASAPIRRSRGSPEPHSASDPPTRMTSLGSPNGLVEKGVKASGRATTSRNRPSSASWGRRAGMTRGNLVRVRLEVVDVTRFRQNMSGDREGILCRASTERPILVVPQDSPSCRGGVIRIGGGA